MRTVQNIFKNTIVRMAAFLISVLFIIIIVSMRLDTNDKQERIAELNLQITEMQDYINQLNADLQRPFDDEYIEDVATEKLGMRYPQEVIFYSGDGVNMFMDNDLLINEGALDYEVLINYLTNVLDGKLGEKYKAPEGRITVF